MILRSLAAAAVSLSLALLSLAGPLAAAEMGCPTPEQLARGIAVKVPKGPPFTLVADRSGARLTWQLSEMRTVSTFGRGGVALIEETGAFNGSVPDGMVGGPAGTETRDLYSYAFAPKADPGKSWTGRVRVSHDFDSASTGPQPTEHYKAEAQYVFAPQQVVAISGCDYRVVPTDVLLSVRDPEDGNVYVLQKRRLIHFPDYGFSVVTKAGPDRDVAATLKWGIVGFSPLP